MPVWVAFVALTRNLCPHVPPLSEQPLCSRGWCDTCRDVTVWCAAAVERRLTANG